MELSEQAKEARRQYHREWRAKNPDYDKQWRENNPESTYVSQKRYKRKNKEKVRAYHRVYQKEYQKRNPDKVRQYEINKWEKKARLQEAQHLTDTVTDTVTPITVTSKNNIVTAEKPGQKTCISCKGLFVPKRKTARYCSDKCRVYYNRKMLK
jgi:hypothetical protein